MPILPIDFQAIILRMGEASKIQQHNQEGAIIAQMLKGGELSELSKIESQKVNQVKPHPEGNAKIEERQMGSKKGYKKKEKELALVEKKNKKRNFEELYKGTIIDVKR